MTICSRWLPDSVFKHLVKPIFSQSLNYTTHSKEHEAFLKDQFYTLVCSYSICYAQVGDPKPKKHRREVLEAKVLSQFTSPQQTPGKTLAGRHASGGPPGSRSHHPLYNKVTQEVLG